MTVTAFAGRLRGSGAAVERALARDGEAAGARFGALELTWTPAEPRTGRVVCLIDGRPRVADLARELGVPPWKVRTVRDQSRSWSPEGIAAAVRAVAVADADIKGQAHDASYTLERLVLTVAGLRESR